jgi:hypothetical protein
MPPGFTATDVEGVVRNLKMYKKRISKCAFERTSGGVTYMGAALDVISTNKIVFCGIFNSVPVIEFTAVHQ